jgi:hypothetical protein
LHRQQFDEGQFPTTAADFHGNAPEDLDDAIFVEGIVFE